MMGLIKQHIDFSSFHKLYRWEILVLFVVLEVATFGDASVLQAVISLLEYAFLALVFYKNKKLGIMYYISFTILTFGIGNYDTLSLEPVNFWGIRLFGFSFNILFSLVLLTVVVITNNRAGYLQSWFREFKFYIVFFLFSLCVGVFYAILSINYVDNFLLDFLTYFPIIIYSYLVFRLDKNAIIKILRYCFALTVFSFILSFVLGKYFRYNTDSFFPSNALYFILPFALLLIKNIYPLYIKLFFIAILGWSFIYGYYFISGKTIMTVIILLLVLMFSNLYTGIIAILVLVLVLPNLSDILAFFIAYYSEGGVIRGKFIQIQEAIDNFDLHAVAMIPSSMGNIVAELITVLRYYTEQIQFFFMGKGFGGGVKDVYGYLDPWTEINGYAKHDAIRNDFFKMHLAFYEVFVKTGLVGFFYYTIVLVKGFLSKNRFFLMHSILLFAVFYVSKETLLVTLLIYRLRNFEI